MGNVGICHHWIGLGIYEVWSLSVHKYQLLASFRQSLSIITQRFMALKLQSPPLRPFLNPLRDKEDREIAIAQTTNGSPIKSKIYRMLTSRPDLTLVKQEA